MYNSVYTHVSHLRPHSNADRLQLATVLGYQVIVGKDVQEGDKVVFFEAGGQLSEEFASLNNLFRHEFKNADQTKQGLFADSGRVKAIRLRGEMSDGFIAPVEYFKFTGVNFDDLEEGFQFCELGGHVICQKYETPAQKQAREQGTLGRKVKRGELKMFKKHFDTEQYKRGYVDINEPGIVYVTEKLHGTSHRVGHVLTDVPAVSLETNFFKKLWAKLFRKDELVDVWDYVHGSKNVVIEDDENKTRNSFYGTDSFRFKATEDITLHLGEVLYGEIVGYVNESTPIMADQSCSVIKEEKQILKLMGKTEEDTFRYSYGCQPGEARFYVYRIVHVNEDGNTVELSWPQVKARCNELGIPHVPEIGIYHYDGTEESFKAFDYFVKEWTDGFTQVSSLLDPKTFKEGVVVRFEPFSGRKNVVLKSKSWAFYQLEGFLRDKPEYLDLEEMA